VCSYKFLGDPHFLKPLGFFFFGDSLTSLLLVGYLENLPGPLTPFRGSGLHGLPGGVVLFVKNLMGLSSVFLGPPLLLFSLSWEAGLDLRFFAVGGFVAILLCAPPLHPEWSKRASLVLFRQKSGRRRPWGVSCAPNVLLALLFCSSPLVMQPTVLVLPLLKAPVQDFRRHQGTFNLLLSGS